MNFHVGQKVVCVADADYDDDPSYGGPRKGEVGTICNLYMDKDDLMLELIEWPSPETEDFLAGYVATCFRPVVERKTDISIFTKMLTPDKAPV